MTDDPEAPEGDVEENDGEPGAPVKRTQATALSYEHGDTAPKVVASGTGHVAERIIEAAREAGVPIRSDPALAEALAALDLGTDVPEALYRAVAEALAWAYKLDAKAPKRLR